MSNYDKSCHMCSMRLKGLCVPYEKMGLCLCSKHKKGREALKKEMDKLNSIKKCHANILKTKKI